MKANKEIGEIINDKVVFLNIEFELEITTGTLNTNVSYDKRVLDKNKEDEFKEYVNQFVNGLTKYTTNERQNDNNAE